MILVDQLNRSGGKWIIRNNQFKCKSVIKAVHHLQRQSEQAILSITYNPEKSSQLLEIESSDWRSISTTIKYEANFWVWCIQFLYRIWILVMLRPHCAKLIK